MQPQVLTIAGIVGVIAIVLGFVVGWFGRGVVLRPQQVHPQPGDVSVFNGKDWLEVKSQPGYYAMQSAQDAEAAKKFTMQARLSDRDVLWEGHPKGVSGLNRIFLDRTATSANPPTISRQVRPYLTSTAADLPIVSWTHPGPAGTAQSITLDASTAERLQECLEAVKNVTTNCTSIEVTSNRVYLELTLPSGYLTTKQ